MDFEGHDIGYYMSDLTKSQLYESLEPRLNSGQVVLLDDSRLESQLLGLVWRAARSTTLGASTTTLRTLQRESLAWHWSLKHQSMGYGQAVRRRHHGLTWTQFLVYDGAKITTEKQEKQKEENMIVKSKVAEQQSSEPLSG